MTNPQLVEFIQARTLDIETAIDELIPIIDKPGIRHGHFLPDSTISRLIGTAVTAGRLIILASKNGLAGATAPNVRQIFECYVDLFYIVNADEPERSERSGRLFVYELLQREKQYRWGREVFSDTVAMKAFLTTVETPEDEVASLAPLCPGADLVGILAQMRAKNPGAHWSGFDRHTMIDRLTKEPGAHPELYALMKWQNKGLGVLGHGGAGWTSVPMTKLTDGRLEMRYAGLELGAELIAVARNAAQCIHLIAKSWRDEEEETDSEKPEA